MRRRKMGKKASRRNFRRGTRVKAKNANAARPKRGGYRL